MEHKKLAIIIPEKDNLTYTLDLINSIIYHSEYERSLMKLYIADTGSKEVTKEFLKKYLTFIGERYDIKSKFLEYDYYNFAKINNDVVSKHVDSDTELILLCNNDVALINDAISMVVDKYDEERSGTVGARLMYRHNLCQHCGIVITKSGGATHFLLNKEFPKELEGKTINGVGNTGAFMLTSLKLWKEIGGLNEAYKRCFEDVEYNLKCLMIGKVNTTVLDAVCFHYESQTRGREIDKDDVVLIRKKIGEYKELLAEKNDQTRDN